MAENVHKNVAFVVGVIQFVVQKGEIELSKLAFMLPILLDDKMVAVLNDNDRLYSIESIVATNKLVLANYNERYLSSLSLLYQAVALLLDVKAISMKSGRVLKGQTSCLDNMLKECGCENLICTCEASVRLLNLLENHSMAKLYKLLQIEI